MISVKSGSISLHFSLNWQKFLIVQVEVFRGIDISTQVAKNPNASQLQDASLKYVKENTERHSAIPRNASSNSQH